MNLMNIWNVQVPFAYTHTDRNMLLAVNYVRNWTIMYDGTLVFLVHRAMFYMIIMTTWLRNLKQDWNRWWVLKEGVKSYLYTTCNILTGKFSLDSQFFIKKKLHVLEPGCIFDYSEREQYLVLLEINF
jgi:hypothetical protein